MYVSDQILPKERDTIGNPKDLNEYEEDDQHSGQDERGKAIVATEN